MKNLVLVLLSAIVALSGCQTSVGILTPEPIEIFDQRLTLTEISDCIKLGASKQGWEVTEEGTGYVLVSNLPDASAKLNAREGSAKIKYATIRVDYNLNDITVNYTSSENLKYNFVTDDKQIVHYEYNRAINGLAQSVRYQIEKKING